jgi:transposase, IS5 family
MMFQALVLQNLYPLSDQQLEFQITGRLSCQRFLGLAGADKSPDEKTFRALRETLTGNERIEPLLVIFHATLEARGMFARQGQMVEATFVEAARPRNSREDTAAIKGPARCRKGGRSRRPRPGRGRWTRAGPGRTAGATPAAGTM